MAEVEFDVRYFAETDDDYPDLSEFTILEERDDDWEGVRLYKKDNEDVWLVEWWEVDYTYDGRSCVFYRSYDHAKAAFG